MAAASKILPILSILARVILSVTAFTNIESQNKVFASKPSLDVLPDIRQVHAFMMADGRYQDTRLYEIAISRPDSPWIRFPVAPDAQFRLKIKMLYRRIKEEGRTISYENVPLRFDWPGQFHPHIEVDEIDSIEERYEILETPIDVDRELMFSVSTAAMIMYQNFGKRLPKSMDDPFSWLALSIRHEPLVGLFPRMSQPSTLVYNFHHFPSNHRSPHSYRIALPVEHDGFRNDLIYFRDSSHLDRRPEWLRRKLRSSAAL